MACLTIAMSWDAAPEPPTRPQVLLDSSIAATPVTGQTIQVAAGADFQAALDQARPGDVIVLQAGATFTGNFVLPVISETTNWITIRTSDIAGLPKEGMRVTPENAKAMPKLVDPNGRGAISTSPRCCRYRLIGLEITAAANVRNMWGLVNLGNGGAEQNSLETVPHHLILDRLYVLGRFMLAQVILTVP